MRAVHKRLLSQNFLVNRQLVTKLVRGSSISPTDLVLEIGSGTGIITQELQKISPHVIAIEKDPKLTTNPQDFLAYPLPAQPYKVFSNIPFSITGEIVRKLLQAPKLPQDVYLVMQNEAACKFMIHSDWNTMAAILYYPFWEIKIIHRFQRSDFSPQPKVESVFVNFQPRTTPFVAIERKDLYQDFVAYHFTHDRFAKFVPNQKWPKLFASYLLSPKQIKAVKGSFKKLQRDQSSLEKIHRSRTDKNWRKFRNR
jgi:23S rRNA (adenine-N6)-dimethyltransferase